MADERDLKHFAGIANGNEPKFEFENSKQLAAVLGINHDKLMEFYWYLENQIIMRRHLIKCALVLNGNGGKSYIKDMSDAFILAAFVNFGKKNDIVKNDF